MNYRTAVEILRMQDYNVRKIDGTRVTCKGYEYRVKYYGGFASYIGIDRREVGKRNFKYYGGVSAAHCMTMREALDLVLREIAKA